jgi:hypothetical protein
MMEAHARGFNSPAEGGFVHQHCSKRWGANQSLPGSGRKVTVSLSVCRAITWMDLACGEIDTDGDRNLCRV